MPYLFHCSFIMIIHWASKETYHFFRETLKAKHQNETYSGYRLAIILIKLFKHIKNTKRSTWAKKEKIAVKSEEVSFQNHRNCALQGWEIAADKNRYIGYITRNWNCMKSYWIFWIGCLRGARLVSTFCDFRKLPFFHQIFLRFDTSKLFFWRSYQGVFQLLCVPIWLINRRSDEFLLTLSVYRCHTFLHSPPLVTKI